VGHEDGQAFSPQMKDANLDWDSITAIIQEGEQGKIVEVEDEVNHKTVEVWVEGPSRPTTSAAFLKCSPEDALLVAW
jgi:hypothetical protein